MELRFDPASLHWPILRTRPKDWGGTAVHPLLQCRIAQLSLTNPVIRPAIILHPADALEKMSCVNQITTRSGNVADNEECTSFRAELRRFRPMAPWLIGFQDTDERKPPCRSSLDRS